MPINLIKFNIFPPAGVLNYLYQQLRNNMHVRFTQKSIIRVTLNTIQSSMILLNQSDKLK